MNSLSPLAPLTRLIAERRKRVLIQNENRRLIFSIIRMIAGLAVLVAIFLMIFGIRVVDGNDMYPALCDGDLVLTYGQSEYIKNDIVFYETDGKEYCGRVAAKAGDNINFSDDKLFVNGTAQTTEILFPTSAPAGWEGTTTVPEDTLYILGDFRTQCEDSRVFGFIPLENVKSKAIVIFRHKTL